MATRFWTFGNDGLVRLSLEEGQSLHHSQGGPTDEGWYRHSVRWSLVDGIVTREICSDGRDCDGRLMQFWMDSCPVDRLAAEPAYDNEGILVPAWESVAQSQRDEYAEAAGY